MPDLFNILEKRWKFILGLTLVAGLIALVVCLIRPKEYLSVATAIPTNSVVADKARLFNENIEALYSSFGSPDELDRFEGTASLDTIYISTANEMDLIDHYKIKNTDQAIYKASQELQNNSRIIRTAYGQFQVKVWDKDPSMAAQIANGLMKNIQQLHQHLQNESNLALLASLKLNREERLKQYRQSFDSLNALSGADAELWTAKKTATLEQLQEYEKMIDQYELAVTANPPVLLTVEKARVPVRHDKPDIVLTVLLSSFTAFAVSFLLALFVERRRSLS